MRAVLSLTLWDSGGCCLRSLIHHRLILSGSPGHLSFPRYSAMLPWTAEATCRTLEKHGLYVRMHSLQLSSWRRPPRDRSWQARSLSHLYGPILPIAQHPVGYTGGPMRNKAAHRQQQHLLMMSLSTAAHSTLAEDLMANLMCLGRMICLRLG